MESLNKNSNVMGNGGDTYSIVYLLTNELIACTPIATDDGVVRKIEKI